MSTEAASTATVTTTETAQTQTGVATAETQTTAPVTDIRSFMNEKGEFVKPGWAKLAGVPDTYEGRFKTLPGALASYGNLEKAWSSANKVAVPNEKSSPEEWDAFYAKLGRPEKAEAYEIKKPDALKDVGLDEAALNEFKGQAFKQGLNVKQVQALADWYFNTTAKSLEGFQANREKQITEATDSLKQEWGTKFNENLSLAKRAALAHGGEELLADETLANNPAFIKFAAKVGMMTKEAPMAAPNAGGGAMGIDPQAEISKVMADKSHPYHNIRHPDHDRAVDQVAKWFAMKNPEQK
jgi:hypothetical protein